MQAHIGRRPEALRSWPGGAEFRDRFGRTPAELIVGEVPVRDVSAGRERHELADLPASAGIPGYLGVHDHARAKELAGQLAAVLPQACVASGLR